MEIKKFRDIVWEYYQIHKRSFPWRETTNPYFIFLSEVMLQQTQTSRVVEKYTDFITAFSTVEALAQAPFAQVLGHWSGLGYNRRAKFLYESAKVVVEKHHGTFPREITQLDELPGIGANTAAAIVVYTFNIPTVFIETNIRRTFIHHFFENQLNVHDNEILPLVEKTLDQNNPREWYWALMDYGAALPKVVVNPNRKSRHYTKQSKFVGSRRQVRGSILKVLLKYNTLAKNDLMQLVEGNHQEFENALKELVDEGMVLKTGDRFGIQ